MAEDISWMKKAMCGNGVKGYDDRINECETEIETLKTRKPPAPKMSGKQIAFILGIYLAVASFIGGYIGITMDNLHNLVITVDQRLHEHVTK